jgi:uncharacterized protein (TIGR03382 family)
MSLLRGLSLRSLVVAGLLMSSTAALAGPVGQPADIVGGKLADAREFPTVVAVLFLSSGGGVASLCTGTLIHPEWVLTAAHCLQPAELGAASQDEVTTRTIVAIDTGTALSSSTGRRIRAATTIPHPDFTKMHLGDNDIGLIKLSQRITDRKVTAINRAFDDAKPGVEVVMVGFGATAAEGPTSGGTTAGTEFVLRDRQSQRCATLPISMVQLSDSNVLCFSQKDQKGKCNGDSGGPSFARIHDINHIVGVTSFGDSDCTYMGADTRVDAETAFLDEHVSDLRCVYDGVCADACGKDGLPVDYDCIQGGPRSLGATCTEDTACDSGLCARSADGNMCTERCAISDKSSCPNGFACTPVGDSAVCWPHKEDSGGCSASGGRGGAGMLAALALGLVIARRRR